MSQLKEDLEAAYTILEERGWCQGQYRVADGRVCAKGALRTAVLSDAVTDGSWISDPALAVRYEAADGALRAAVPDNPDRDDRYCPIAYYNDLDSTSAEDVKLMFKRAIEACEEAA